MMHGSAQRTMSTDSKGYVVLVHILILCCLDFANGTARIPSVNDCHEVTGREYDCKYHGFQNVPYDYFEHFGAIKL